MCSNCALILPLARSPVRSSCTVGSPAASIRLIWLAQKGEAMMRQWWSCATMAGSFALVLGVGASAQTPVGQPTSEGHPHKWQTTDKSLYDLVSDGYKLVTVAYDTAATGAT